MKRLGILSAALFMSFSLFAQRSLVKVWESDSTTLKLPESVLYDSESNSLYVSSMGAGSIVRMDLNGKIIKSDWITGLKSNKGMALFGGLLYTAEQTTVAVIDIEKAEVIKRIPIEGAEMLNDVTTDSRGIVYVSDTRTGKVHRIENDKPALYLENLAGANGLLAVGTDLYVTPSSSFIKVNANREITKIAEDFENGLDGIVLIGANEFILSNYRGLLYHVNADGKKQVFLDSRVNKIMANDISYNDKTKTLYVPSLGTNRIIAYTVK
jgi:hypothetical protein